MAESINRSQLRQATALVFVLMVVHAPLIVNNGRFADDWLLFDVGLAKAKLDFLLHGAGHPILFAYCWLANVSGDPINFVKIMALVGIGVGALSLRSFLIRLRLFSEFEAFVFSFLVWSYAGFQTWATKNTETYVFDFGLLCLGLNTLSKLIQSKNARLELRLICYIAFFLSFSLNSMIAAYGLGLFAIIVVFRSEYGLGMMGRLYGDFVLLPVIYWFSVNFFFPKRGPYKDYYLLRIPSVSDVSVSIENFLRWGYYELGRDVLILTQETLWPIALALLICSSFVGLFLRRNVLERFSLGSVMWPAIAAVGAFVTCASPYLASGISPSEHFFESRHLILFGIPLALALICGTRTLSWIANGKADKLVFAAVTAVLALNLCALWSSYFAQQARWLRQDAMIIGLQRKYPQPPAMVFNLEDGFLKSPGNTFFGIAEITGALHLVWGDRPLLGFTRRNERPTVLQEMDKLIHTEGSAWRSMDPWGPQATIVVLPNQPIATNYQLSRSYYLCLIRFCDMRLQLKDLATITVRVGPIPNLAAPGPDAPSGTMLP